MNLRPTTLAAAFVAAAAKEINTKGANVERGTGNWIARHTVMNTTRKGFEVPLSVVKQPKAL